MAGDRRSAGEHSCRTATSSCLDAFAATPKIAADPSPHSIASGVARLSATEVRWRAGVQRSVWALKSGAHSTVLNCEVKQRTAEKRAIEIKVYWMSPRQEFSTWMQIYFFQLWFWSTRARPPVSMLHMLLILHSHILQGVSRTCRLLPSTCSLSSYQAMRSFS